MVGWTAFFFFFFLFAGTCVFGLGRVTQGTAHHGRMGVSASSDICFVFGFNTRTIWCGK